MVRATPTPTAMATATNGRELRTAAPTTNEMKSVVAQIAKATPDRSVNTRIETLSSCEWTVTVVRLGSPTLLHSAAPMTSLILP
jgi:hypothetical protein